MKTKGFDEIFEEKENPLKTQWVASGTAAIKESNPAAKPEPGDPVEEAIDREIKYEGIYGDGPIAKARQRDETAMMDRIRTAYRAERERLMTMVPKVVIPRMVANHWKCKCGAVLYPGKPHPETKKQWVPKYCMDCGSKLNWEDSNERSNF